MGILEGKAAIVTGAGRGIGRGEALLLAAEGASVIVNDSGVGLDGSEADAGPAAEVVEEIRRLGGTAVADGSDVSSWEGAEALVQRAFDEFGDLGVLVNNAGILRDRMIANVSADEWDDVIAVHLRGHIAMLHHASARWRANAKAGKAVAASVVNTASEVGLHGNIGQAAYGAAKGGILSLTLTAARELARYGVRVNAVCPRARTRMTEHAFGTDSMDTAAGFDDWAPDNVAPFVAYLASDEANWINGQVFIVGGSRVRLQQGWTDAKSIETDGGAFDVRSLVVRAPELFESHRSVPVEPEMLPGQSRA